MVKFVRGAWCSFALLQAADAFRSIGSSKKKRSKGERMPEFETLLFNEIAAANFANPISEDDGVAGVMEVLGAFAALDGVASMVVGLVAFSLSDDDSEFDKIANIMESVSHLVDDRIRVLKVDTLRNSIEDIHKEMKEAYTYPYKWVAGPYAVGMRTLFSHVMNDAYGGGGSSCWNRTDTNNCKEWRNDGNALMLAVEFTELLIAVCTEVHDYILSMDSQTVDQRKSEARVNAIQDLDSLGQDLKKATNLVSEHFRHFELRRRDYDSPSHGLLARVGDCQQPWHSDKGCDIIGPYDQMRATRICHDGYGETGHGWVNREWLDELKLRCQLANRRRFVYPNKGGCRQKAATSWFCERTKGPPVNASCFQPRLDNCTRGYKMAIDKDLETLRKKVDAVKKASAKVVKDAAQRLVCVRQPNGECYTTRRRRNSRRRRGSVHLSS